MKTNKSAVGADQSNGGDCSSGVEFVALQSQDGGLGSGVKDQVRCPAREASIFRPCRIKVSIDALKLVV